MTLDKVDGRAHVGSVDFNEIQVDEVSSEAQSSKRHKYFPGQETVHETCVQLCSYYAKAK